MTFIKHPFVQKLRIFLPLLVLILALVAFIDLTSEVLDKETLWLDSSISKSTIGLRTPELTSIMIFVSDFGERIALVLAVLLAIFTAYKKRFWQLGNLLFTIGTPLLFTYIFKKIIQRPRPDILLRLVTESSFSFPSGHATVAFTIYPILAIWLWYNTALNKIFKVCLIFLLGQFTLFIGLSRVYLGVHYFSDILAGAIIGLSMAWLYYTLRTIIDNSPKISNNIDI